MTEEEIKVMQAEIADLKDANEKITKNRDDILGEKRGVQSRIDEKDEALRMLAEEKLKLAGDMDGLKSLYEKESAETIAKLQEALDGERNSNRKIAYDKEFNSNIGMFHDSHKGAGKAMLSNALKISYNSQGEKETSYVHDGVEVAKTAEEFKTFAMQSNDYKQYLKGVDSSGANTTQSASSAGGKDMTLTEQAIQANKQAHKQF